MKNVILLNNRSLHLYDFKELKIQNNIRITAILFENRFKDFSPSFLSTLDHVYVIPEPKNSDRLFPSFPLESLESIVEGNLRQFDNTWISAADEVNNLKASLVREKYQLSGAFFSVISNYKDKFLQKKILMEKGIKTPKFMLINHRDINEKYIHFTDVASYLNIPFIIKPINMFGTIGVEEIHSLDEFMNYIRNNHMYSSFIAEEFIKGQLYHCDFIIKNDLYEFIEVSEYMRSGLSFINGFNHGSILLLKGNPLRSSIIEFCKNINTILGLKSGSGHIEIFLNEKQELIFLEAAARPAGSAVPIMFTKTFNKNFLNAALLADIDENVGNFANPSEFYFWSYFPKKPGIVKSFRMPPIKSTYDIEWYVKTGQESCKASSVAEKSGFLLVKNSNYETLKSDFNLIRDFEAIEFS